MTERPQLPPSKTQQRKQQEASWGTPSEMAQRINEGLGLPRIPTAPARRSTQPQHQDSTHRPTTE